MILALTVWLSLNAATAAALVAHYFHESRRTS